MPDSRHHTPRIHEYVKDLKLSDDTLCDISERILQDIEKGLSKAGNPTATIKCFQTYVQDFPTGKETGKYLALDLGGTNFRVLLITLGESDQKFKMDKKKYEFPQKVKTGTGEELFDYVAECVDDFLKHLKTKVGHEIIAPMGFTFSFPVFQKGLNIGIMIKWTKGFDASGVVGKDVVLLLKEAFIRKNMSETLAPVAILNDTTGTLMSCAWEQANTRVGLIVGTGCNACYSERIENIENFDGDRSKPYMIINMEWGNFGSDGRIQDILSEYDKILDSYSHHSGEQLFEKLVSGRYLGELMRLIIVKSIQDHSLFNGKHLDKFDKKFEFKTEYMSRMESDQKGSFLNTENVLRELGIIDFEEEDLADLHHISETLTNRSASLVSCGVATVLNKMNISPVTVGVDGSLYRFHPRYKSIMEEKIRCMTKPSIDYKLMLSEDGSGRGAALVAAVLARTSKK